VYTTLYQAISLLQPCFCPQYLNILIVAVLFAYFHGKIFNLIRFNQKLFFFLNCILFTKISIIFTPLRNCSFAKYKQRNKNKQNLLFSTVTTKILFGQHTHVLDITTFQVKAF